MIKTPKFWFESSFFSITFSFLLTPISLVFLILSNLKILLTKQYILRNKTVICIGNIIVGGAGKTPVAISLCSELKKTHTVCFISKGYGRNSKGFVKVNHDMEYSITGDEPQLLQRHAQVYLYTKIQDIITNISHISEEVIIMDDGLQNNAIYKNCNILVLDDRVFGNKRILPAGPLRETINSALRKTDFIISTNITPTIKHKVYSSTSVVESTLKPQKVVAFSGIGDNLKFVKSLQNQGFDVIKFFAFPDHHPYSEKNLAIITKYAQDHNLPIITTEKDYVKINYEMQALIHTLQLTVNIDKKLVADIRKKLALTN